MPNFGIAVLGLNDIQNIWQASDYGQGKLIERTAWSCPHGNLARWNGVCPCDGGYNGGWKSHFASAFRGLNNQIDAVLDKELGASWADSLVDNFSQAFYYQGSANSELSLLAAKASALGAQISCGTFFSNPNTSGRINVMFARQAIENLRDANYKNLADKLGLELRVKLAQGMDPFTGKNLTELYSDLLYEE